jgi:hypothetical protein
VVVVVVRWLALAVSLLGEMAVLRQQRQLLKIPSLLLLILLPPRLLL